MANAKTTKKQQKKHTYQQNLTLTAFKFIELKF